MSGQNDYVKMILDMALKAKEQAMDLTLKAKSEYYEPNQVQIDYHLSNVNKFFAFYGGVSILSYLLPTIYHKIAHNVQNLKKKYNATWAVVTGGSSGIGLAIVERLASQGCNVVIVAYPDSIFEKNLKMVREKYPNIQFREVGVDLSKPGQYLEKIKKSTEDIPIQIVFNNAGYIKTGFFCDVGVDVQLANHTCNATAALEITHHFVSIMLKNKWKGCVGYTSSPAGFTPCPFSVVYGATKAYLTEFATSIAPELKSEGIDVCVVHPSPVSSRFYEGTHSIGALLFFKGTATGPEKISDCLFASMGRTVVRDQGYYPIMAKMILKLLDYNFLANIIASSASMTGDFTRLKGVQAPARGL